MIPRLPAPALSPDEPATVARFDAAPVPPEVVVVALQADEGCSCGQTDGSLLAEHAANCALMLCRRCRMVRPDHLPGEDICRPCTRPHADVAIAAMPASPVVEELRRAMLDLADNLDYYASKTTGGTHASGLSDAATQLRAALAGQHTTDEEADRG